jgi:hypothetical protein
MFDGWRRKKRDDWAGAVLGDRAAEVSDTVDAAMANLTVDGARALPWVAIGSMMNQIEQGALDSGPDDFRATALLGACQHAVFMCSQSPELVASLGVEPPEGAAIDAFCGQLVAGASELGMSPTGQQVLLMKTMPAALDGLQQFGQDPERLVHHVATYFVLAVASGLGTKPPTAAQMSAVAQMLPSP